MAEWIPVSERLPDEHLKSGGSMYSDYVLVTVYDHNNDEFFTETANTKDGEWHWDGVYYEAIEAPYKVIAWMPLPEPYMDGRR